MRRSACHSFRRPFRSARSGRHARQRRLEDPAAERWRAPRRRQTWPADAAEDHGGRAATGAEVDKSLKCTPYRADALLGANASPAAPRTYVGGHLSRAGNALVARALREQFERDGIWPR